MVSKLRVHDPIVWGECYRLRQQAIDEGYITNDLIRIDGLVLQKTEDYGKAYNLDHDAWALLYNNIRKLDGNWKEIEEWLEEIVQYPETLDSGI